MFLASTMLATMFALAQGGKSPEFRLVQLGRFQSGAFGKSAVEVASYDPARRRLAVVNVSRGIDLVDIADPSAPKLVGSIALRGPTSVAAHGDLVAALSAPERRSERGELVILDADLRELSRVTVGHNPDMVTFTPDGKTLVVGNEGEEDTERGIDPEGTVSIVDISGDPRNPKVKTADFGNFEDRRPELVAQGASLADRRRTVAQQLEPEYVAVSADGRTAFVTMQEANAIAVVDIPSATVTSVHGLGFKDFSACGLDPSDKDGGVRIAPWPVVALRQPDTVVTWKEGSLTWLATSNEGEKRESGALRDAVRVSKLKLDPLAFPASGPSVTADAALGRLEVSAPLSDTDGDGDADRLVAFGGRGVTLWTLEDGRLVERWDSGSACERTVAERMPAAFNADHETSPSADDRSDGKGPEPEGLATGIVDGHRLLFVGLERAGGVIAWDVTDPAKPVLVDYANARDPTAELAADADKDGTPDGAARAGDLGPEGLVFIPAAASPNGKPLLAVCNEVSGTLTIWEVRAVP